MQLRGLILSLQEFNIANEKDPERFVMEDGLTELLDGLYRYQVQIINLDLFHAYSVEKLQMILQLYQIEPKECLLFAASDQMPWQRKWILPAWVISILKFLGRSCVKPKCCWRDLTRWIFTF